jgi:hypothetical protein
MERLVVCCHVGILNCRCKYTKSYQKLDFPLVSNSRSAVVLNGNAYIAVNDPKADAIYIWEYNPTTDKLTKGAKILGGNADTPMLYNLDQ